MKQLASSRAQCMVARTKNHIVATIKGLGYSFFPQKFLPRSRGRRGPQTKKTSSLPPFKQATSKLQCPAILRKAIDFTEQCNAAQIASYLQRPAMPTQLKAVAMQWQKADNTLQAQCTCNALSFQLLGCCNAMQPNAITIQGQHNTTPWTCTATRFGATAAAAQRKYHAMQRNAVAIRCPPCTEQRSCNATATAWQCTAKQCTCNPLATKAHGSVMQWQCDAMLWQYGAVQTELQTEWNGTRAARARRLQNTMQV